jgi:hypothetical protein
VSSAERAAAFTTAGFFCGSCPLANETPNKNNAAAGKIQKRFMGHPF